MQDGKCLYWCPSGMMCREETIIQQSLVKEMAMIHLFHLFRVVVLVDVVVVVIVVVDVVVILVGRIFLYHWLSQKYIVLRDSLDYRHK